MDGDVACGVGVIGVQGDGDSADPVEDHFEFDVLADVPATDPGVVCLVDGFAWAERGHRCGRVLEGDVQTSAAERRHRAHGGHAGRAAYDVNAPGVGDGDSRSGWRADRYRVRARRGVQRQAHERAVVEVNGVEQGRDGRSSRGDDGVQRIGHDDGRAVQEALQRAALSAELAVYVLAETLHVKGQGRVVFFADAGEVASADGLHQLTSECQ